MTILVDTNILIDIIADDPRWADASLAGIRRAAGTYTLTINVVVYAELAAGYGRSEDVDDLLSEWRIVVADIPRQAAFLAGKAFKRYRQAGGTRTGVLSDFFIGAQAQANGLALLTRDPKRYRTYFPSVELIVPAP